MKILSLLLLTATAGIFCAFGRKSFEVQQGHFMLDSDPITIKAAELHYPRIPQEYWRHRIQMCKSLGMNTICVYVFWNFHEENEGNFNFEGDRDIRKFIEMCGEEGMNVIVRPGPYVCAEWEMGGLPWWLLKDKDIKLRENDERFIEAVARFQKALAEQLKGLTVSDGGPVIMIQVENEYGSYGIDKEYVAVIRDILRKLYPDTVLFQCDWSSNFTQNGLDDLLWTLNFGTWTDPVKEFSELRRLRPDSPLMCSEYWSGWFDKWGANHETRSSDDMIAGIRKMLDNDISFSLYMTHGGTNFSHWAGANSPGYAPDVTSYDYDAPIDERGNATPKYFALRALMQEYSDTPLSDLPDPLPVGDLPEIMFNEIAPIYDNLPDYVVSETVQNMESLNQGYGSIIYRTILDGNDSPEALHVNAAHDYATVFINGEYVGKLDRRFNERVLTVPPHAEGAELTIFVEGTGRINFGRGIKDFKGITDNVTLGGKDLKGWEIYCLPDEYGFYDGLEYVPLGLQTEESANWKISNERYSPGVYRAYFDVETPKDTWLDMSDWGKGVVYLNGFSLGRFWEIGPQQTLYAPGCRMKEGRNEILVFDVKGPHQPVMRGLSEPVMNCVREEMPNNTAHNDLKFSDQEKHFLVSSDVIEGEWTEYVFEPAVTRYILLESDDKDMSLGEIRLTDYDGKDISPEDWKIFYVNSEERLGNHTADKIIDLQETTYWLPDTESDTSTKIIILDMGTPRKISGMKIFGGRGKEKWTLNLSIPTTL